MHVIARRTLVEFWTTHPDSEEALKAWYHEADGATWAKPVDVKKHHGSASIINSERLVFNVCGNKYRLIVRINYASQTVFIRFVGTHKEYDKVDAETI